MSHNPLAEPEVAVALTATLLDYHTSAEYLGAYSRPGEITGRLRGLGLLET